MVDTPLKSTTSFFKLHGSVKAAEFGWTHLVVMLVCFDDHHRHKAAEQV